MKILKVILTTLGAFIIFALLFGWYIGFFKKIKIKEKEVGGFKIVGLELTGSYTESGKTMVTVEKKLKKLGVICENGFGIYYDDPKYVPENKCRSFVGNILEEKDFDKITELQLTGLKIDTINTAVAIVIEFPVRNSLSYMIGSMKVYPAISKYMTNKGLRTTLSMEIYDNSAKKVIYITQYEPVLQTKCITLEEEIMAHTA